ncbi:ribosomal RNA large subunit methyltransferase G [Neiella marina]|uniref:Ribosomal RNA large subunit methyltransferase G n=1 Tax=Neiella marina TaxID=508461 RepID=A0A8J2U3U1_9GAMM|nr:methyltransferase [Neiella marina]GGA71345.1 ribosomal RNA large subunit methyltransferase G [Neiella marina]
MYSPLNLATPTLELARFPLDKRETLLPFDAADELIMEWWHRNPNSWQNVWILNDSFGALSCFFNQQSAAHIQHISDSFLAQQALLNNLKHNQLDGSRISLLDCLQPWPATPEQVIIKVPKNLTLLKHQLARISRLPVDTPVIIGARLKDLPAKAIKLLKQAFGNVVPELAKRKARIMHAKVADITIAEPAPAEWQIDSHDLTISNHANVFSRASLDIGADFLLKHLPQLANPSRIVDLGCGNGVLALAMAKRSPEHEYILVDESHMAIASAKANAEANFANIEQMKFNFLCQHSLTGFADNSIDFVICNPPFHQQQAITDEIAWQMFSQAHKALRSGGKLRIVGNRHLGYHIKLKRIFGGVSRIAANAKFVILESEKRD